MLEPSENKSVPPYNREKVIPQIIYELIESGKDMLDIYNGDINKRIFEIYGFREDSKTLSNWKYRIKQQLAKKSIGMTTSDPKQKFDDLRPFIKCRDRILKALQPIKIESGLDSNDFKELVKFSLEDFS